MTGYDLSRQWFDFAFENSDKVSGNHTALYWWSIELNNRLGWVKKFAIPTDVAMAACGIKSYKTYGKIFDDLAEWGFFEIHQRSKNQFTSNVIALVFFTEAEPKQYQSIDQSIANAVERQSSSTVSINKLINLETNKPKNDKTLNIEFVVFWDLYDNRRDRAKTEKKWNSLSNKERELAIADVPKYLASLRDRHFQKNPLTYLNGQCWEDEREEQTKEAKVFPLEVDVNDPVPRKVYL